MDKEFVKELTNIEEDFAKWYTDIVLKAELADYTDTKGCIAIKPYGYAIRMICLKKQELKMYIFQY